jgi:hypothetical protein
MPASPASHLVHLALPGSAFSPNSQLVQFFDAESSLFEFFGHSLHNSCPNMFWYSPGMHGKHDACLSLV